MAVLAEAGEVVLLEFAPADDSGVFMLKFVDVKLHNFSPILSLGQALLRNLMQPVHAVVLPTLPAVAFFCAAFLMLLVVAADGYKALFADLFSL